MLASSQGRRDEIPNAELAIQLTESEDVQAIRDMVAALAGKNKAIQGDCIKVLYEIGDRKPLLISPYVEEFVRCLKSKTQRLVWGGMTALHFIARVNPRAVFAHLSEVMEAAEGGSVIARDHAVGILIELSKHEEYASEGIPLLRAQLESCPDNQFPMYAEQSFDTFVGKHREEYKSILVRRASALPKASQVARVSKLLRKLGS